MYKIQRKQTQKITLGSLSIGGDSPISVQSMTTINTLDIENLLKEIDNLEKVGCQIIRITIPNIKSVSSIPIIKKYTKIPIVADIHFNHKLALLSMDAGIDKIRINPGNIGDDKNVKEVLSKAKETNTPIRIGINSGSIEKNLLKKYGHPTPEAMIESAQKHIRICLENDFHNIMFSLKSSNVQLMIEANRLFSQNYNYPLHLGVTEAGPVWQGTIKSSIGIGTLLAEGIGDTIRVSLTGDPVEEVRVGYAILKSLNLIKRGINIVSCPTCGRTISNVVDIAKELEESTKHIQKNLTVAVMGCVVNGPGEAIEADIGVACGKNNGTIFCNGKILDKIPETEIIQRLLEEIDKFNE